MSDNIKYYYLKLKDNFFDSEEMKILESQKNGVVYQNFYLKLCLLSLKSEGRLIFKDYLPYDEPMLSTVLRIDIDTVKTGLEIFIKMGLVEIMDSGLIFMTDIQSLIGTGSSEGDRKKSYRKQIEEYKKTTKGQMSGQMSTKHPRDIRDKDRNRDRSKKGVFTPPTLEQVTEYITLKGYSVDPKYFHEFFTASDWIDTRGHKVLSWKQKVITWERMGTSFNTKTEQTDYPEL